MLEQAPCFESIVLDFEHRTEKGVRYGTQLSFAYTLSLFKLDGFKVENQ